MTAGEVVRQLTEQLRSGVPFQQLRIVSPSGDYLEGVLARQELTRCTAVLGESLGAPVKSFGAPAAVGPAIGELVAHIGGIRLEQSLYARQLDGGIGYAALWPWASDATRVTLKVGLFQPTRG